MTAQQAPENQPMSELLLELRQGPVPLASSDELARQRDRLLPSLRAQVRTIPQRRRRQRWMRSLSVTALAAGFALAIVGTATLLVEQEPTANTVQLVLDPQEGSLSLDQSNEHRDVTAKTTVAANGTLEANGAAALTTARGVRVALAKHTRVSLNGLNDEARAELHLLEGSVDCSVPPLGPERRFQVTTNSARVIVHGTRFRVTTETKERTCVQVAEGSVEVIDSAGGRMLTAGQSWGCEAEGAERGHDTQGAVAEDVRHREAEAHPESSPKHDAPAAPVTRRSKPTNPRSLEGRHDSNDGTLQAETNLFSRALSAERRGDVERARTLYAELLRRYPGSPFVPEAREGLARLD